jgi:hypothetical protein
MEEAVERIVKGYFRGEDLSELIKTAGEDTREELRKMSENHKKRRAYKSK